MRTIIRQAARQLITQKETEGERPREFLIVAKQFVAARCALTTAGPSSAAHPLRLSPVSGVLAASFANRARPAANQSPYSPSALRTILDRSV